MAKPKGSAEVDFVKGKPKKAGKVMGSIPNRPMGESRLGVKASKL